jgi:hypothetical protein
MAEELVPQLINLLKSWAKKHNTKQFSNFYVFGSLINESGNQFLRDRSDIDLIVILRNSSPLNRARVCQKLQKAKLELELRLRPLLQRRNKSKSIVSLVLVTENEVIWDIHKSKSSRFFRDNKFLNLLDERDTLIPIEIASPIGLDNRREAFLGIIQAIEEAQKYRNKYLSPDKSKSPNKSKEDNEQDIFPKDLARSAAQVRSFDVKNENGKFDMNLGNIYLISLLNQKDRKINNEWSKLNRKVGSRRGRSAQKPILSDFDLLLLYELLFDKAYKLLLRQNSSINLSKGGHRKVRGDSPASPAAKVQRKKTPEAKTESQSSTVAREYGKTTSVDPAKPATAKKKSTSRKTPVSKTNTNRGIKPVKDPGNWVMLNEKFYRRKLRETKKDLSIVLQLSPTADMEQVAELKSLHPGEFHNRKQITYADQSEVGIMQVSSVESESSAGKTSFKIMLTPTQRSQNSGFAMEMNYNNYSADEIARLRARLMLLGEPLPKDLELLFPMNQVETEIFPELWVKLHTQSRLFLPKAWLKAVYCLKMNGIVEDVLELELGPINNKVMPVRFRGRRRQVYANREPSIINFEGSCTLGE